MQDRVLGNRYRIIKKLGKGGRGLVYLCHDMKLHKDWAVKELEEPLDLERSMELELLKTVSCNVFPTLRNTAAFAFGSSIIPVTISTLTKDDFVEPRPPGSL